MALAGRRVKALGSESNPIPAKLPAPIETLVELPLGHDGAFVVDFQAEIVQELLEFPMDRFDAVAKSAEIVSRKRVGLNEVQHGALHELELPRHLGGSNSLQSAFRHG